MRITGFIVYIAIILSLCGLLTDASAELTAKLISTPSNSTFTIGQKPQKIILQVQANQQNVTCAWALKGPGKLDGDPTSTGRFYLLPKAISEDSAQVVITVEVSTPDSRAKDSLTFTLLAGKMPPSSDTPTLTPTLTPTRIPTKMPTIVTPAKTPAPRPTPTPTPDVPVDVRLDGIKSRLASSLERYKQLKIQEEEGKSVGKEVVKVLTDLIATLKELEDVYVHSEQADMLEKVPGVRQAREKFTDELSRRKK